MTVEKKKSQVNTRIRYSKYEFSLLCRFISLDASAEHLVIHQDNTVRLMNSRDISVDCGTSFLPKSLMVIVPNYSTKAGIAPKHPQYLMKKTKHSSTFVTRTLPKRRKCLQLLTLTINTPNFRLISIYFLRY